MNPIETAIFTPVVCQNAFLPLPLKVEYPRAQPYLYRAPTGLPDAAICTIPVQLGSTILIFCSN
jgi:hypothetical protein